MVAIDSSSGRQVAASWTHTADSNDRAIAVFLFGFTAITGFTHAASAVTYGNVPLTLRLSKTAVSSHICVWVLYDWDDFDARDDDVVRVTGGSWSGGSNGQYAGASVLLESATSVVDFVDEDADQNIALSNGSSMALSLTASGTDNVALVGAVTNGSLNDLAGQSVIFGTGHHIGMDYLSSETGLSGTVSEGFQNVTGSNASVVAAALLFADSTPVFLDSITPEVGVITLEAAHFSVLVEGLGSFPGFHIAPSNVGVVEVAAGNSSVDLSIDTHYPSAIPLVTAIGVPQRMADPDGGLTTPMVSHDGIEPVWVEAPTGVTDHGALTGLADDDHPQYATDVDLANHEADLEAHHPDENSIITATFTGARTIDRADAAVHDLTLSGNATLTLDGAFIGRTTVLWLWLHPAGHTITWDPLITWVGGTAPSLSASLVLVVLASVDDGVSWSGVAQTGGTDDQIASEVPFTPVGTIAATDTQTAVAEVATDAAADLSAHTGDTSDAHDASAISVLDAGGYYAGSDVEAALQEAAANRGHFHIIADPLTFDGSSTVYYLSNLAEEDTPAAYNKDGARVAVTHDLDIPDKITFAVAPAAGTGYVDYVAES